MPTSQRRIAVVAVILAAIAMVWMLTHRKGGMSPDDLQSPKLLALTAKSAAGARPLTDGAELTTDEVLDFQVQVFDLCFVYIVRVDSGTVGLAFGHLASDEAWSPGVYAPTWVDPLGGMRFRNPSEVKVYAIASPQPLVGVGGWDVASLDNVKSRCSGCAVTSAHFTVKKSAAAP